MSPPRGRKKRRGKGQQRNPRKHQRAARGRAAAVEPVSRPVRAESSRVVALDPLAPIIVRSGRPFDDGSGRDTARFPPPTTIAGCLRTAWARQTGRKFDAELAKLGVEGPLLVHSKGHVLVPKPADASYFGVKGEARCVPAAPRALEPAAWCDLPSGLLPVQLEAPESEKPGKGPSWWALHHLLAFRRGQGVSHEELTRDGWSPPPGDRRTHVKIGEGGAAQPGMLFQTEGLDFSATPEGCAALRSVQSVRLLLRCSEPLRDAVAHLGGERRLATLRPERDDLWPTMPRDWPHRIAREGGLCLTLLTPGYFAAGYRPGWLDENLAGCPPGIPGLRLKLQAVALERWQANSGWDLAKQQPRPARKLAPAGSTYWFRIEGVSDEDEVAKLWLASVSDDAQARRDGFGLALPAPWRPVGPPEP